MRKLFFVGMAVLGLAWGGTVLPDAEGVGSGACSDPDTVWYINGIGGTWLAVGEPNILNRRDRVVFRFPVLEFMHAGRVGKATLYFDYTADGEHGRDNLIEVEHFTAERIFISGNDLNCTSTDVVGRFTATVKDARNSRVSFDVTDKVNADLRLGFGFSAFRVRSVTADTEGNPNRKSSYLTVENGSMKLVIEE